MSQSGGGYLEDLLTRLRATVSPRAAGSAASHSRDASATAVLNPRSETIAAPKSAPAMAAAHDDSSGPAFWRQFQSEVTERWLGESALDGVLPSSPLNLKPSFFAARAQTPKFFPHEPDTLEQAHLGATEIETLILKFLLNRGTCTGRDIAAQVRLSFKIVQEIVDGLRTDQMIAYKGSSMVNDYEYQLTPAGRDQARRLYEHSTYFGSAPVTLEDYVAAIGKQSLNHAQPRMADLQRAFHDLLIPDDMLCRLAQAIHHGRGLFLHGAPGNGKTSIAQRITRAFGELLWIPRAIGIDGEIIRLYDPCVHEELPMPAAEAEALKPHVDHRWIRIRRPTILVGGELTMDRLDITRNTSTGTNEAPLQMKSNCGTLVIDDFGRQRISVEELLNRWIVPLDKGYDFLSMPSGKTIQVPFDQMLVFSTNLQPRDLADEAFLRRIPYKLDVSDPSEEDFRELMRRESLAIGVKHDPAAITELIERHYRPTQRAFRCSHALDLLLQVRTFCQVYELPLEMNARSFDAATANYFAVL